MSCSQVKPMPPCTCSPAAITRRDASEHQALAMLADRERSGSPAAAHQAA